MPGFSTRRIKISGISYAVGARQPAVVPFRMVGVIAQKNRTLTIQFQGIQAGNVDQFKQAGKQVILHPNESKSGNLVEPYTKARG